MSEAGQAISDAAPSAPSSSATPQASTPAPVSSPSDSGDLTAPAPSATDSPPPSSSETNTRQSDREGLLAAVRSVVKTSPDKPAEDASAEDEFGLDKTQDKDGVARETVAPGETKPPEQAKPAEDIPDPTEVELSKLRPETRKRFERLLSQRNQARRELQALQPEITQSRQLQGYLRQNQLATDDVNTLLGIGAALRRGDFQAFLNGVTPFVMTAQEALGLRIPKDLQGQVDQGLISVEAAGEMSRTRFRAGQAEHRLNEQMQTMSRQSQEQVLGQVQTAVNGWEADIRSRDPDYQTKAVAVRRFAQALLAERGAPRDAAEAVSLIQAAYDEATSELARIRPAPKATRQVPAGSQGSTVSALRAPATMKDAALQALQGMRKAV